MHTHVQGSLGPGVFVARSSDKTVKVWDASTRQCTHVQGLLGPGVFVAGQPPAERTASEILSVVH